MLLLRPILLGVVLPAGLAGALLLFLWRPWEKGAGSLGAWAGPLALGAGTLLAQILIQGIPPLPPLEATHWIPLLVLAAAVLGALVNALKLPAWLRHALAAGFSALIPFLTLRPLLGSGWSALEAAAWLGGSAAGIFLLWTVLEAAAHQTQGPVVPVALGAITAGTALVLVLTGSILLGQLAGGLAASLGAVALLALWNPERSLGRGGVAPWVTAFAALWLNGAVYSEMTILPGVLLASAPLLVLLARLGRLRALKGWLAATVVAMLAALPVAAAVLLAWRVSAAMGNEAAW
jgi:hypothetical protein